jgi:hypothetical protein
MIAEHRLAGSSLSAKKKNRADFANSPSALI